MNASAPAQSRARSRLGVALLLQYGYAACSSALLALPLWQASAASGIGQFPEPDQQLFREGGLWLVEVIRVQEASLLASLPRDAMLFVLLAFGAILPEWWLFVQLAAARKGTLAGSRSALGRLGLLGLFTWLLRGACWAAALGLSALLGSWLRRFPDERVADLGGLALVGSCGLLQLLLSLGRDALSGGVVAGRLPLRAALALAVRLARRQGVRLLGAYAAYRLAGLCLWSGTQALTAVLGGADGTHPVLGIGAHQLGLLLRVLLRAAWLTTLLARLERELPPRSG